MAEPVDIAALGERLKRTRTERSATLKDVAQQTEVSIPTLSRIERGDTKSVDSPTLLALAKWMGVTAQEFLAQPEVQVRGQHSQRTTPDVVELHLRADKRLDKQTAVALAKMFRAAYDSLAAPKGNQRKV